MLWLCLLATIDIRSPRAHRRFEHKVPFELEWDANRFSGTTEFLSEGDATIPSAALPPGCVSEARLSLPTMGLFEVPVTIQHDTGGQWSLQWTELSLSQQRALITYLYCRPGQWDTKPKSEVRAFWEYARASLRMFPLAESH
jgi:cellulose synthase (UDP-forming)